jgi:hypothetical protein
MEIIPVARERQEVKQLSGSCRSAYQLSGLTGETEFAGSAVDFKFSRF